MLVLLKNATVMAPVPLGRCDLLVGGGRILRIFNDLAEPIPGAEIVDCDGLILVPGFIDGHSHLTGGGGEAGFKTRVPAPMLSHYTSAGVTSVVGVLGTDDTTRDTRSLLAQVYALRDEGISAWCHTGGYHVPPVTFTGNVRDDIVFLDPVIGVGELAISDHRSSQPSFDEIIRIASDAYVAGLITQKAGIVHLHMGDGDRGLELVRRAMAETELPARVFNPTHVNRRKSLFDEALAIAELGCSIDITAFPADDSGGDEWSAADALIRFLDAGAPADKVTISSDGGGCLPVFDKTGNLLSMDVGRSSELLATLHALLEKGLSLAQALPAFTSNVADLLRLRDKGRIDEGQDADLLLLDNNHKLHSVMIGGHWHVRDYRQLVSGQFESSGTNRKN